jgi:hypothetical protein
MRIESGRWHDFFTSTFSLFLKPVVDIFLQKFMTEKLVAFHPQKVMQNVHPLFVSSYF